MPETQEERNSKRIGRRWNAKTEAWNAWWEAAEGRRPQDSQSIAWIHSAFEMGFMQGCDHALQDEVFVQLRDIRSIIV